MRHTAIAVLVWHLSWIAYASLALATEDKLREAICRAYKVPFVENPRFCILGPGEGNACRIEPYSA